MGAPYGTPRSPDYNTFAVLSPIFAVVVPPAGVVLGHLALPQIRRSGERGRNAAIAGLVLGYLMCLVLIAALIWWLTSDSDSGNATASPSSSAPYQVPPAPPRPSTVTSVAPAPAVPRIKLDLATVPIGTCVEIQLRNDEGKRRVGSVQGRLRTQGRGVHRHRAGPRQLRLPFGLRRRAARPLLRPVPEPVLMPMNILETTTHQRRTRRPG
jgi:hypothetical protein